MKRAQTDHIIKDLQKKMVFLAGPRQVGKTYLAKQIAATEENALYLNYDAPDDREIIQGREWRSNTSLLILDELHKMPAWKNYLKGVFDTKPPHLKILVTGSARLDIFNQVGDSLAGRYFLHRLLPLSPAELTQVKHGYTLDALVTKGGFPEPFLQDSLNEANRWRQQYINSILSTDVFEFEVLQNIRALRLLFELLQRRVGATISYQTLALDLEVSPHTVKRYIEILESLYIIFRVTPFSKNIARSLLKEPKIYFYDVGLVNGDEGAKYENLVALCLLKQTYAKQDYEATDTKLHYLRTKDGHEVDFAIVENAQVVQAVEVKLSAKEIAKSLFYFYERYPFPCLQVVKELKHERNKAGIEVLSMDTYLKNLYL